VPFSAEPQTRDLAIGHIAKGALLLGAIVVIGVAGYVMAGWPLIDALYMVIITIFGVGYGEVRSVDHPAMKFFTMGLIVAGCSAGLWVIGGLVEFMADGKIREALGRRRMSQQIEEMTGHAIVCGFGRVGQILSRDLAEAGMPLLVVDTSPERLALAESLGYPTVAGDAAEERTLRAAHIDTAKVVAVVLPDDAANVFVTLSARELSDSVQIIARGERPDTERKLLRSGATRVVLPAAAGANRIARMITHPPPECLLADAVNMNELNQHLLEIGLEITEFVLAADSDLVGAPLSAVDLRETAVMIIALRKPDGEIRRNPHGTTTLEAGDAIILVGRHGDLPRSLRLFASSAPAVTWRGSSKA
jgi:voltage-gated potassium channel